MDGSTVADRYVLGASLGAGGMAQVHRAHDDLLGRDVAVKLFGSSVDPHGPDRVRSEMRTLAGLSHPGLVTLYDAGTDVAADGSERAFFVMQLVDGPSLAARLREGPLHPDAVRALGIEVADALAYVHTRGVVHRDIKPANILLDEVGRARIADFGIAQTLDQETLTATGFTLGTVPYLSPEQVRGQSATAASDVYALGLVLLEALTGRREYPGMTAEGALARLSRPPVVPPDLPAPWSSLLTAMTALDPAARPDAAGVADVLRSGADLPATVMVGEPTTATMPVAVPLDATGAQNEVATRAVTEAVPVQRRRRRGALIGVGALALGGVVAAGLALGQGGSDAPAGATTTDAVVPSSTPVPSVVPVASRTTATAAPRATTARPTSATSTSTRGTSNGRSTQRRTPAVQQPAAPPAPGADRVKKDKAPKAKTLGGPGAKAGPLGLG